MRRAQKVGRQELFSWNEKKTPTVMWRKLPEVTLGPPRDDLKTSISRDFPFFPVPDEEFLCSILLQSREVQFLYTYMLVG